MFVSCFVIWLWGLWDLRYPVRDWIHTPCIGPVLSTGSPGKSICSFLERTLGCIYLLNTPSSDVSVLYCLPRGFWKMVCPHFLCLLRFSSTKMSLISISVPLQQLFLLSGSVTSSCKRTLCLQCFGGLMLRRHKSDVFNCMYFNLIFDAKKSQSIFSNFISLELDNDVYSFIH